MAIAYKWWTDSHWDAAPSVAVRTALVDAARRRYDALLQNRRPSLGSAALAWLRAATKKDRSRMDAFLDNEAEQGARLVSEYSVADCFLCTQNSTSHAGDRLVVGVAAENVAEAGIHTGDLLGEPDGVDYCPAPAALPDVWTDLAILSRDHFGRIKDGTWIPDPMHGGSFEFVQGALSFVRELVPRIRRAEVQRWECRDPDGKCELVDLARPRPLLIGDQA